MKSLVGTDGNVELEYLVDEASRDADGSFPVPYASLWVIGTPGLAH